MPATNGLTDDQVRLFLRAACCLIAADGAVKREEIAVLSEALSRLGFPQPTDKLRDLVIATCKEVHGRGVENESKALVEGLRLLRGSPPAQYLRQVFASLAASDGGVTQKENHIAMQFQQAIGGSGATAPPPMPSAPQSTRSTANCGTASSGGQASFSVEALGRINWKWIFPILLVVFGLVRLRLAFTQTDHDDRSKTQPVATTATQKPIAGKRSAGVGDVGEALVGHWRKGTQHLFFDRKRYVLIDTAVPSLHDPVPSAQDAGVSVFAYTIDRRGDDSLVLSSSGLFPVRDSSAVLETCVFSPDRGRLKRQPLDVFFGYAFDATPAESHEKVVKPDLAEAIYGFAIKMLPQFLSQLQARREHSISVEERAGLEAIAIAMTINAVRSSIGSISSDNIPANFNSVVTDGANRALNAFLQKHADRKKISTAAKAEEAAAASGPAAAAHKPARNSAEDKEVGIKKIATKLAPQMAASVRELWQDRNAKAAARGKAAAIRSPPQDLEEKARAVLEDELRKSTEALTEKSTDAESLAAVKKGSEAAAKRFVSENSPPPIW
jgi:hypothetical protein